MACTQYANYAILLSAVSVFFKEKLNKTNKQIHGSVNIFNPNVTAAMWYNHFFLHFFTTCSNNIRNRTWECSPWQSVSTIWMERNIIFTAKFNCFWSASVTSFTYSVSQPSFVPMPPLALSLPNLSFFMSSILCRVVTSLQFASLLIYRLKMLKSKDMSDSKSTSCDAGHRSLCFGARSKMFANYATNLGTLSNKRSSSFSLVVGGSTARLGEPSS